MYTDNIKTQTSIFRISNKSKLACEQCIHYDDFFLLENAPQYHLVNEVRLLSYSNVFWFCQFSWQLGINVYTTFQGFTSMFVGVLFIANLVYFIHRYQEINISNFTTNIASSQEIIPPKHLNLEYCIWSKNT